MTDEQRQAVIDAEVQRVATLARSHLESVYREWGDDEDTLRVDHALLGFVLVYDGDEGQTRESYSIASTNKTRYGQDGILAALARHHDRHMRGSNA